MSLQYAPSEATMNVNVETGGQPPAALPIVPLAIVGLGLGLLLASGKK